MIRGLITQGLVDLSEFCLLTVVSGSRGATSASDRLHLWENRVKAERTDGRLQERDVGNLVQG